ncbi:hypothetical protein ACOMHN_027636 [Nucella lapillus]
MSVTLPRRLCMGVTMGPALTEAATQAIKLPENTPASSDPVTTGRQTDDQRKKENRTVIPGENLKKCIKSNSIELSYLSGNTLRVVDKQSTLHKFQGVVGTITVPARGIKVIHKGVLLPNLVSKNISATSLLCGKVSSKTGTMNRPPRPTSVDKDHAKHVGHAVQNRSQTCSEMRGGGKARQAGQLRIGSHLYVQNSGGNLYSETSQIRPALQAATERSLVNAMKKVNNRHVKCTSVSKAPESKESTSDGHEVDRVVSEQGDEASKKQAQLERRLEFLQRRLRRVQARQVEQHVRHELASFASHQRQNLHTVSKSANKSSPGCPSGGGDDLNKELLSDGAKHMSTAALVSLVHKMQKQGATSQLPVLVKPEVTTVLNMSSDDRKDSIAAAAKMAMNLKMMQSALDSDATESSSGGETDGEDSPDVQHTLPATPLLRRAEWKWASQRAAIASRWTWLQAQVSDLEYRIRQQTELYRHARTSKGLVVLAEPHPPPQTGQVSWHPTPSSSQDVRTLVSSASAARKGLRHLPSNGDLLQSQPTSQSALQCSSAVTGSNSSLLLPSSHSTPGVRRTHQGTCSSRVTMPPNRRDAEGGGGSSAGRSQASAPCPSIDFDPAADPSCRAARCFPLKHPLRKRQLVRTSALEGPKSAKAAKLSWVKCRCHSAATPCVLCCRKERRLQGVDPHFMSFQERVAIMDSAFHPVLSFHEEVPLSVHFEGLLRSGEWQNKPPVRRPRAEQGQRAQKHKLPNLGEGRKALLRKNQSSVIIQSAKIRNKYEYKAGRKLNGPQGMGRGSRPLSSELKGLKHAPFVVGRGRGTAKRDEGCQFGVGRGRRRRGGGGRGGRRGGYMRPHGLNPALLGPDPGGLLREVRRRRRGESAYDINSIVIPRSMAALTRVERLEYKEIPIPSWRETRKASETKEDGVKAKAPGPKSNGLIATEVSGSEEREDLQDEAYALRHSVCERAERRRFSSAIRFPKGRRRARALHLHDNNPRLSTPVTPPAVAPRISVELEDEETDTRLVDSVSSRPQSPALGEVTSLFTIPGRAVKDSVTFSRPPVPPETDVVSPGWDWGEQSDSLFPSATGWPLRKFPLTDDEVSQLEEEDRTIQEEREVRPQLRLTLPLIPNLCPQPVETGGSQAGSSVAGSLPPSPLAWSSSGSVGGGRTATWGTPTGPC